MTIAREAKSQVRERDMAIAVLFLHMGLRVSELAKLELVNVELERGQIKITQKGNKEQYLHLNSKTINLLVRYLASHRVKGVDNILGGWPVFMGYN